MHNDEKFMFLPEVVSMSQTCDVDEMSKLKLSSLSPRGAKINGGGNEADEN